MNRWNPALRAAAITAIVALLLAGCASGRNTRAMDTAGMTRDDVGQDSLHDEFDRYRKRYERMQAVMADAQRVLSDDEWDWVGGDDIPDSGIDGGVAGRLPGTDPTNSYYLNTTRVWMPEGASGAERDLDPMIDYFTDHGWPIRTRTIGDSRDVWAATDDGWHIAYVLYDNGRYALDVYSGVFWTNDYLALVNAIDARSTLDFFERSRPGEYPRFPRWEDPVTERPDF